MFTKQIKRLFALALVFATIAVSSISHAWDATNSSLENSNLAKQVANKTVQNGDAGIVIRTTLPSRDEINLEPWLSYNQILAMESRYLSGDKQAKIDFYVQKAIAENLLYFHNDFAETARLIEQLVDKETSAKNTALKYYFLGMVYGREGQYKIAIESYNQAIDITHDAGLHRIYVLTELELAHTRSLKELYETSLVGLQEAYLKAYTMDDQYLIAQINETYGAIYGYMREFEKSAEYHQKAIDTFKHLNFKGHIADSVYGLASTYRYWGKYDLAIQNYKHYADLIAYTPNTDVSFYSAYGLGMTYAEKNDCLLALTHIEQALQLHGMADYDAELYKRKASCLIQLNRLDEAEQALVNAETIFAGLPELSGTQWDLETRKVRAFLTYARGDQGHAFELLNQYYEKHISLMLQNSSDRLVRVRAAMDLERQNVELVLLDQRNKVQSLLAEQQQQENLQQRYLIAIGVVLIAVIFFVFVVQQHNNKKVLALSIRDPLSGLYNRRYIFDYLDKVLATTSPEKASLSLIMLDIDNFKELNDQYGHPFGDKVIVEIAVIVQDILRVEDVMGRIGGEEFLCVLPRVDSAKSLAIAERMRKYIAEHKFVTADNDTVQVTVSIGVARTNLECFDRETLYGQVDTALYQSKHSGKNKVTNFVSHLPHFLKSSTPVFSKD